MSFPASLPGESNPNHKLDECWVRRIRRLYDQHVAGRAGGHRDRRFRVETLRDIAAVADVSHETVRKIGLRRTWRHLPEAP